MKRLLWGRKLWGSVVPTVLLATGAFGGALDDAWIKGTTDRGPVEYKAGEDMVFTLSLQGVKGAIPEGAYQLAWKRTGDDELVDTGKFPLSGKPFVYRTKIAKPGFVRFEAWVEDAEGNRFKRPNGRAVFFDGGAGADVGALSSLPEPKDFDDFWAKQFARLDKVPIKARTIEVEPLNKKFVGKVHRYAIEIDCAGLRPVTGYLQVPIGVAAGKRYPVHLFLHGYSADTFVKNGHDWYGDDEIYLDINAHGMKLPAFGADDDYYKAFLWEIKSGRQLYGFDMCQNADPVTAYFNGMVLRVKRALQYLKTVKGWNGKDVIASGESQGGLQTIWAAACGEGVTRAESAVTWCCDMFTNGTLRWDKNRKIASGGWYIPWVGAHGYYDAANWAKRIPPMCRTIIPRAGLGDYTCPPTGLAKLWNNIRGNKKIVWVQGSQHQYIPPKYDGRDFTVESASPNTHRAEIQR